MYSIVYIASITESLGRLEADSTLTWEARNILRDAHRIAMYSMERLDFFCDRISRRLDDALVADPQLQGALAEPRAILAEYLEEHVNRQNALSSSRMFPSNPQDPLL